MISAIKKDFYREIKNSRNRFLSIMVLAALAVAFLSGLKATAPDMKGTGDAYFDEQHLLDVQILSTLGLTEEDIEALAAREEVALAKGAYVIDAWTEEFVTKVYSITEGVNDLLVMEGRLPETSRECVVDRNLIAAGMQIGDSIRITPGDDYEDALRHEEFTIVGVVRSPYYLSVERGSASIGAGSVQAYLYLPESSFDMEAYTTAFLLIEGAAELTAFYEEYDDYIEDVIDGMESFGEARAALRYEDVIGEATEKIADAEIELADAKAEAEQELADAEKELADARKELDDGWREYRDGMKDLREAYPDLLEAEQELADAEKKLTDGEKEYADGLQEYRDGLKEWEEGKKELDDALYALGDGKAQLDQSSAALGLGSNFTKEEADAAVSGALAKIDAGIAQCDQGIAQAQAGIAALDGGIAQCDQAMSLYPPESPEYQAAAQQKAMLEQQKQTALDGLKRATDTKTGLQAQRAELAAVSGGDLYAAQEQLKDGIKSYEEGRQELLDAEKELKEAEQKLADARKELDDGWLEFHEGKLDLAQGWRDYHEGQRELPKAYRDLTDGEEEYAEGYAEYLDGKQEAEEKIADAEEELADARRKVADIESGEWFILSRAYNPGYPGFGQDADRMASLSSVFPIIFFLVAALVCLTTMTRMVEEYRTQIGLMKALGYGRWAISRKYLSYGLLPSLAGSALGLAIGHLLFPSMIYVAYQIMYEMPNLTLRFYPGISLWATVAAVGCTTASALFACMATLLETPASLMRPKAPKPGKRVLLEYIPALWRRMSFNWKITTRNLMRYLKRFWMTVIGIGGCTALIITGFGLRDSLLTTMRQQYGELFLHDAQATLASNLLESERDALHEYLDGSGRVENYTEMYAANVTAEGEDYSVISFLQVMEADEIGEFIVLRDYDTKEPVSLTDEGAVVGVKFCELLGLEVGDSFTVTGDGRHEITVAAVSENYVGHYIYLTPAYYEKVFGEPVEKNAVLMNLAEDSDAFCETVLEEMLMLNGVSSATRTSDTKDTYMSSMERVDFVVVIVILCAAALAIVVLYNLSNINITERKRELATIKVLGFFDPEVTAYVTRENVVLTAVGIAFGCFMGKFLHIYLVRSVEIDLMMFGRELFFKSYLWASLLTVLFSGIVNGMAHKKMKTIDMVESLKSAE